MFWLVLASGLSAHAADTPAQAAARAALERVLNGDNPQPPPALPAPATNAVTQATTIKTNTVLVVPPTPPPAEANVAPVVTMPVEPKPATPPPQIPVPAKPSWDVVEPPHETATVTNTVHEEVVAPQIIPAATNVEPAVVTPVATPKIQSPPAKPSWDVPEPPRAAVTTATNPATPPETTTTAMIAPVAPVVTPVEPKPQSAPVPAKATWDVAEPAPATNPPPAKAMASQNAPAATTIAPTAPSLATPAPARLQSIVPKPVAAPAAAKISGPRPFVKPTNEIVTIYGTVYKNAQVEKADWEGVVISYWTSQGGLAMSKLNYTDLPAEFRERYQKNMKPPVDETKQPAPEAAPPPEEKIKPNPGP